MNNRILSMTDTDHADILTAPTLIEDCTDDDVTAFRYRTLRGKVEGAGTFEARTGEEIKS